MTIREMLANWLTGGMYSHWQREASFAAEDASRAINRGIEYRDMAIAAVDRTYQLQCRLNDIAACETPGANATVKRMARIARGEE